MPLKTGLKQPIQSPTGQRNKSNYIESLRLLTLGDFFLLMIRKVLILSMITVGMCVSANAFNAVKMTDRQQKESVFYLNEHPTARLDEAGLKVFTDNGTVSLENFDGVTFELVDYNPLSVEEIDRDIVTFQLTSQYLEGRNLTGNSAVSIVDISGKIIMTEVTTPEGSVTLDISGLPGGVYVFSSVDRQFKFQKK